MLANYKCVKNENEIVKNLKSKTGKLIFYG